MILRKSIDTIKKQNPSGVADEWASGDSNDGQN